MKCDFENRTVFSALTFLAGLAALALCAVLQILSDCGGPRS